MSFWTFCTQFYYSHTIPCFFPSNKMSLFREFEWKSLDEEKERRTRHTLLWAGSPAGNNRFCLEVSRFFAAYSFSTSYDSVSPFKAYLKCAQLRRVSLHIAHDARDRTLFGRNSNRQTGSVLHVQTTQWDSFRVSLSIYATKRFFSLPLFIQRRV